jgi:hypothetical protein
MDPPGARYPETLNLRVWRWCAVGLLGLSAVGVTLADKRVLIQTFLMILLVIVLWIAWQLATD